MLHPVEGAVKITGVMMDLAERMKNKVSADFNKSFFRRVVVHVDTRYRISQAIYSEVMLAEVSFSYIDFASSKTLKTFPVYFKLAR